LQHRGQESAGIISSDDGGFHQHKEMGHVADIFDVKSLTKLSGDNSIGHVRYSTSGESVIENSQPFAVNAKGVFLCCKAAAKQMKKQGYGKIINTASQAGKKGIPNLGHYCASKAAVILLTKTLALELAEENINVNCI
jgi:glutamine phosphoribosylpyrophosphate amidotransferase